MNDRCRAADAGLNFDSVYRAIFFARAAFHAPFAMRDVRFALFKREHLMRADLDAAPAADAAFSVETERLTILQITHLFHNFSFIQE